MEIVTEIKNNINDKNKIKSIITKSKAVIGSAAKGAGHAYAWFSVGKHLARGDAESLVYDAGNLYVIPKAAAGVASKIFEAGVRLDSEWVKGFAPHAGRFIGNALAIWGLGTAIKDRINDTDEVDKKIDNLNIITNSIVLSAEFLPEPLGAVAAITAIVVSDLIQSEFEVEKLEEQIALTDSEKHAAYWNFVLGNGVTTIIQDDIEAKSIYEQYIKQIMAEQPNVYSVIAITLPKIIAELNYKCSTRVKPYGDHGGQGVIEEECSPSDTAKNSYVFDNNNETKISLGCTDTPFIGSRIVPQSVNRNMIMCGPTSDNVSIEKIGQLDGNWGWRGRSRKVTERWSFVEYGKDCKDVIVYRNSAKGCGEGRNMLHITSSSTELTLPGGSDITFSGKKIKVHFMGNSMGNDTTNTFYFPNESLEHCVIELGNSESVNFFYVKEGLFCNLTTENPNLQSNVVITKGNFSDFKGINSIVGDPQKSNQITVFNAKHVDGKGGSDIIIVEGDSFPIIKGYFNDTIKGEGKGLLQLPLDFRSITKIINTNNETIIYDDNNSIKVVNRQMLLKTADGFFISPTKTDKSGKVTHLQVTVINNTNTTLEDNLNKLRQINSPHFSTTTKHLSGNGKSITLAGTGHHIFHADECDTEYYWEGVSSDNLYLTGDNCSVESRKKITIAGGGIVDFSQSNISKPIQPTMSQEGMVVVNEGGLKLTLLPNYQKIKVTPNAREYYKFKGKRLKQDYCPKEMEIKGRFSVDGSSLTNNYTCLNFNSKKVLFAKCGDDLLLFSSSGVLLISNYYSLIHERWNLSIKLKYHTVKPEDFRKNANHPHSFKLYNITSTQGLQIYHNQPTNTNDIGLVHLENTSILDVNMEIKDNALMLTRGNNTLVKVENWRTSPLTREMSFVFKDAIISNAGCMFSVCKPEDILEEFKVEKEKLSNTYRTAQDIENSSTEITSSVGSMNSTEQVVNSRKRKGLETPLGTDMLSKVLYYTFGIKRKIPILKNPGRYNSDPYTDHEISRKLGTLDRGNIGIDLSDGHIINVENEHKHKEATNEHKHKEAVIEVPKSGSLDNKIISEDEYYGRFIFGSRPHPKEATNEHKHKEAVIEVPKSGSLDNKIISEDEYYGRFIFGSRPHPKAVIGGHKSYASKSDNNIGENAEAFGSVSSAATRPSSFINSFFKSAKGFIGGLFTAHEKIQDQQPMQNIIPLSKPIYGKKFLGEVQASTTEYLDVFEESSSASTTKLPSEIEFRKRYIDVDGAILLLDVLIRKITGQRYVSTARQFVSLLEAQTSALNITEEFEKVLNFIIGTPADELIDLAEVQSKIFKAIMSGNGNRVPDILCSYVTPIIGPEKAKGLLATLQTTKTASNPKRRKDHKLPSYEARPQSCLNNVTIDNKLVEGRSAC